MEVLINNRQRTPVNPDRLTRTAEKLLRAEGCPESSEVSVLLVDDAGITELNRQYKGKDRPTDVLSFHQYDVVEDGGDSPSTLRLRSGRIGGAILGDVVISVDTAQSQADERGKSLDDEMDLLLAHGILHLLGLTDDTEDNARTMHERAAAVIGEEAAR